MKKLLKVAGLYIFIGLLVAAGVTFTGGYSSLVVNSALGPMSAGTYAGLMAVVAVGWLPAGIAVLRSDMIYLSAPFGKMGAATVIAVFTVAVVSVLKEKRK